VGFKVTSLWCGLGGEGSGGRIQVGKKTENRVDLKLQVWS